MNYYYKRKKFVENFLNNLHKSSWFIGKNNIEWNKNERRKINMQIVGNEAFFTKEEENRIDKLLVIFHI